MSNTGSTRGHTKLHRRRGPRRSTSTQVLTDFPDLPDTISLLHRQRSPMVGSNRRCRGYQPDEVNKKQQEPGLAVASTTQNGNNVTNPSVLDHHPKAFAAHNKPALSTSSRSNEDLAPHQKTRTKDKKSNQQSFANIQVATMDISRPEPDLVHFDGVSEPVMSEVSSTQIITERKPSCWSIASPPEAPPTEWNSAATAIDRPAPTKLPIYRIPKSEQKVERDNASCFFSRQGAKVKPQARGSRSKALRPDEVSGSSSLETPRYDGAQAAARVTSQEEDHAADSLQYTFEQLQHDERLAAEEVSQIKAMQDEVLSRTVQASPTVPLESDELRTSSVNEDALQAKSTKRKDVVLPHLRVKSIRPGPDVKNNSPLGTSAITSTAAAAKATAQDEKRDHGRDTTSEMQVHKLPPHLQVISAAKNQATKDHISANDPSITSQNKEDSYRPTIDMDEEIVAGLRAETTDAIAEIQSTDSDAHRSNEQNVHVLTHARASFPKSKASVAESKSKVKDQRTIPQVNQHEPRIRSTNTRSMGFSVGPYNGALQGVSSARQNAKLASPRKNIAVPDGPETSIGQGRQPAKEVGSVDCARSLVGWDGKMNQPPVGDEWDCRRPFDPRSNERLRVIEAWRNEHAADGEESNRLVVDTASADFQTGAGLAGGDEKVLSPIDKKNHETLASNDDFTHARRHQSAAEAIKDFEAKIAAKPKSVPSGIEGMTKEEKRRFRRILKEEARTIRASPNPYAPAANIYLRPAEFKDMGQVMTIDNYYVRETNFVLHLDTVDELYWRSRLQEAENERNPFVVAIHNGERSCRYQEDIIRKKQENVVGFAVAADLGNKHTMYHSSVELELMVHPKFYHQGIGRTLLDRILAALSPDHNLLECAPFLPHNDISHWIRGGSRQAKAVIVNIHYLDGEEEDIAWRKDWLRKYDFRHVGTLPQVGFKKGKLVNTCQVVLNTSVRF